MSCSVSMCGGGDGGVDPIVDTDSDASDSIEEVLPADAEHPGDEEHEGAEYDDESDTTEEDGTTTEEDDEEEEAEHEQGDSAQIGGGLFTDDLFDSVVEYDGPIVLRTEELAMPSWLTSERMRVLSRVTTDKRSGSANDTLIRAIISRAILLWRSNALPLHAKGWLHLLELIKRRQKSGKLMKVKLPELVILVIKRTQEASDTVDSMRGYRFYVAQGPQDSLNAEFKKRAAKGKSALMAYSEKLVLQKVDAYIRAAYNRRIPSLLSKIKASDAMRTPFKSIATSIAQVMNPWYQDQAIITFADNFIRLHAKLPTPEEHPVHLGFGDDAANTINHVIDALDPRRDWDLSLRGRETRKRDSQLAREREEDRKQIELEKQQAREKEAIAQPPPQQYNPPQYQPPQYQPPQYQPPQYKPPQYQPPQYQQQPQYQPPQYQPQQVPQYPPPRYEPPKYQFKQRGVPTKQVPQYQPRPQYQYQYQQYPTQYAAEYWQQTAPPSPPPYKYAFPEAPDTEPLTKVIGNRLYNMIGRIASAKPAPVEDKEEILRRQNEELRRQREKEERDAAIERGIMFRTVEEQYKLADKDKSNLSVVMEAHRIIQEQLTLWKQKYDNDIDKDMREKMSAYGRQVLKWAIDAKWTPDTIQDYISTTRVSANFNSEAIAMAQNYLKLFVDKYNAQLRDFVRTANDRSGTLMNATAQWVKKAIALYLSDMSSPSRSDTSFSEVNFDVICEVIDIAVRNYRVVKVNADIPSLKFIEEVLDKSYIEPLPDISNFDVVYKDMNDATARKIIKFLDLFMQSKKTRAVQPTQGHLDFVITGINKRFTYKFQQWDASGIQVGNMIASEWITQVLSYLIPTVMSFEIEFREMVGLEQSTDLSVIIDVIGSFFVYLIEKDTLLQEMLIKVLTEKAGVVRRVVSKPDEAFANGENVEDIFYDASTGEGNDKYKFAGVGTGPAPYRTDSGQYTLTDPQAPTAPVQTPMQVPEEQPTMFQRFKRAFAWG